MFCICSQLAFIFLFPIITFDICTHTKPHKTKLCEYKKVLQVTVFLVGKQQERISINATDRVTRCLFVGIRVMQRVGIGLKKAKQSTLNGHYRRITYLRKDNLALDRTQMTGIGERRGDQLYT